MSYADPARATGNHPSKDEILHEPTGPIASDSLAADSLRSGGDFADGDAVPSSVKGASSTFANTDTSGATPLHPARSGAAREQEDEMGLGSDEKGPGGVRYPEAGDPPEFSGRHNLDGYTGGPSADRATDGYSTQQADGASDFGATTLRSGKSGDVDDQISSSAAGTGSAQPSAGAGSRPYVDSAPNYVGRSSGAIEDEGYGKPKGKALIEGGSLPPQTKTFIGAVGGPNDPGRLAEQSFDKANAGGGTTGGARDYGDGGENPYDTLESSERT